MTTRQRAAEAAAESEKRVTIWNWKEKRKLSGNSAPFKRNLQKYLKKHADWHEYIGQDKDTTSSQYRIVQRRAPPLVYWVEDIRTKLQYWVADDPDTQQSRLCHLPEEHRRQLHEMVRMVKQKLGPDPFTDDEGTEAAVREAAAEEAMQEEARVTPHVNRSTCSGSGSGSGLGFVPYEAAAAEEDVPFFSFSDTQDSEAYQDSEDVPFTAAVPWDCTDHDCHLEWILTAAFESKVQ